MKAKDRVKDFLRNAPKAPDKRYRFTVHGSEGDAHKYVHRMRVELSRLRAAIKRRGLQIKSFKMRIEAIEAIEQLEASGHDRDNGKQTRVVLVFEESNTDALAAELSSIFDLVSPGHRLIDDGYATPIKKQGVKINVKTS